MTDDEACAILKAINRAGDWLPLEPDGRPVWNKGRAFGSREIQLDGDFTAEQLRAILHFAPKGPT